MECSRCRKGFSAKSSLSRHLRESCVYREISERNTPKKIKLNTSYNEKIDELINLPGTSSSIEIPTNEVICPVCSEKLPKSKLGGHMRSSNHKKVISSSGEGIEKLQSAFKNRIASYRFSAKKHYTEIPQFFEDVRRKVFSVLEEYIQKFFCLKINVELFGQYVIEEKQLSDMKSFNTNNRIITHSTDLMNVYNDFEQEILEKALTFQERDSGM